MGWLILTYILGMYSNSTGKFCTICFKIKENKMLHVENEVKFRFVVYVFFGKNGYILQKYAHIVHS